MYIKLTSNDKVLLSYVVDVLINSIFDLTKLMPTVIGLPIHIKKYTVLRSPHIDKKSRDQWEHRTYTKLIKLTDNSNIMNVIIQELIEKVPGGISISVQQHYKQQWTN